VDPLVIIGAGGHAREVAELVADVNADGASWELLGFLSDDSSEWGKELNGLPVLGGGEWFERRSPADLHVAIGVGSSPARRTIAHALVARGRNFRIPVLTHPSAVVSRYAVVGPGTQITAGCIVTANVNIGTFVVLNRACNVSHDCQLGDYVTVAPGVQLAGNVTLGAGCDVGIGASVIQGVGVGEWTIVGAGAAVTESLPANCTAVGVPAKVIKERPPGWHLAP
jgi:sugar O-acyltransferase (sialic acid O-acetyltransferase NeuD family)